MSIQKITMAAAILTVTAAVVLTACGSNTDENTTLSSATESEIVEEQQESSVNDISDNNDNADIEDILDDETDADAIIEAIAGDEAVITDEESENPLYDYAAAAMADSEWPFMTEITDTDLISEFFLLDAENPDYENMIVMQCPMSASMSEIIIIKSNNVSAAEEALNGRRDKAINQDAWYPNDIDLANASIVGTNGNYAYFIIGENAQTAENSLKAYIDSNG